MFWRLHNGDIDFFLPDQKSKDEALNRQDTVKSCEDYPIEIPGVPLSTGTGGTQKMMKPSKLISRENKKMIPYMLLTGIDGWWQKQPLFVRQLGRQQDPQHQHQYYRSQGLRQGRESPRSAGMDNLAGWKSRFPGDGLAVHLAGLCIKCYCVAQVVKREFSGGFNYVSYAIQDSHNLGPRSASCKSAAGILH